MIFLFKTNNLGKYAVKPKGRKPGYKVPDPERLKMSIKAIQRIKINSLGGNP